MFSKLSDLIPSSATKLHLTGELKASMIISRAGTILKSLFPRPELHAHMKAKTFQHGTLKISVSNASIADTLHSHTHDLKKLLNVSMGEEVVKQIKSYQDTQDPEEDFEQSHPHPFPEHSSKPSPTVP